MRYLLILSLLFFSCSEDDDGGVFTLQVVNQAGIIGSASNSGAVITRVAL